jgi:antitoxin (DNA-binding transcriptional repressor) of toxin-antitoxin stability system
MRVMSLFDAKTHLSGVVASLLDGSETEVRILRHGKAVARLTRVTDADTTRRIGLAKGRFRVPADIDRCNAKVAKLMGVERRHAHSA